MPDAHVSRALALALALAPCVARADERVLWLRERGATRAAPAGAVVPAATPSDGHHAEAARAALARAREQFLAYAFPDAATTLRVAAAEHVEQLVRSDRALALEVLHWAGACALLANDREGAREAFRRALALGADARLPASVFPPAVEAFFEETRRAAVLAGPSVRTIRSVPSGARIEVDGRDEGVTPVTLRLTPGVHYLRLERAGYRPWMGPLQTEGPVAPDQEVVLAEATGRDLRAQAGDPEGLPGAPDAPALARFASEYHVDRVVVALRDGRELAYPPRASFPWPWVIAGGAALVAGAGVGAYLLARPAPTVTLISGSP